MYWTSQTLLHEINKVTTFPLTMVNDITWGLPILSIQRAETHEGFKCQLLFSDFNQNLDVSTNCSKFPLIKFHGNPLSRPLVATRG